jgi:hypothetical protein
MPITPDLFEGIDVKFDVKPTCVPPADAQRWGFKTLASIDNPKAFKATA